MSPRTFVQALAAGVLLAVAGGILWAIVHQLGFLFFLIIAAAGIGYGISEGIIKASQRKSARSLQFIAGATASVSVLLGNVFYRIFWLDFGVRDALGEIGDFPRGSSYFLWALLSAILSVAVAFTRMRR